MALPLGPVDRNPVASSKYVPGAGLERLDQIKFAILQKNGKISIIPDSQ